MLRVAQLGGHAPLNLVRLLLVALLCCYAGGSFAAPEAEQRLAVLEFSGDLEPVDLAEISDGVRSGTLSALRGRAYTIMTRESMAVMLQDMGIELDCAEGECEVETARNVGAAYVVSGQVIELSGKRRVKSLLWS